MGSPKLKVADHVEGCVGVPGPDIEWALGGVLVETLDQRVNVGHDNRLLLFRRFGGEGVSEELAVTGMVGVAGGTNDVVSVAFLGNCAHAFGILSVHRAVAIDISPRGRVGEGERVR